jgi:phosphatidylglycerol:prolipoprotein diacylglycerol transferase
MIGSGWAWLAPLIPTDGAVYGVLFAALSLLFLRRSAAIGLPAEQSLAALVSGATGAIVGTRLFYLLTTGALFRSSPAEWLDLGRGTASWGAYLGAIAGLATFCHFSAASFWPTLDVGASCAGLSEVIGRWACLLAGDDFGRITHVPWSIRFPPASPAFQAHVARGLLDAAAPASLPVHPLQFYLMLNAALVFTLTTLAWRRWRQLPGVTLATFLLLHGSTRFWWEFLRDPAAGGASGALSVSQWTCLGMATAGGMLLWSRRSGTTVLPAAAP